MDWFSAKCVNSDTNVGLVNRMPLSGVKMAMTYESVIIMCIHEVYQKAGAFLGLLRLKYRSNLIWIKI